MDNERKLLDCNVYLQLFCAYYGYCYCKTHCLQVVKVNIYAYSFSWSVQSADNLA